MFPIAPDDMCASSHSLATINYANVGYYIMSQHKKSQRLWSILSKVSYNDTTEQNENK